MRTTPLFRGDEDGLWDYAEIGEVSGRVVKKQRVKQDPAFGRKIKRRRLALGIKQDEFAAMCGIHQVTMSRYETATTGVPDERRAHIEKVLNDLEEKS